MSEDGGVGARKFDEAHMRRIRSNVRAFLMSYSVKVSLPGEEFRLASGGRSRLYVDAKRTVQHCSMHESVAHLMLEQVRAFGQIDALAGVVLGGCHLASIVAMVASVRGQALYDVMYVRKKPKDHGTGNVVEAPWQGRFGQRVVLLEDVLSTGRTSREACEALIDGGYDVCGAVALVDRRLPEDRTGYLVGDYPLTASVPLRSVFKLEDLVMDVSWGGITSAP